MGREWRTAALKTLCVEWERQGGYHLGEPVLQDRAPQLRLVHPRRLPERCQRRPERADESTVHSVAQGEERCLRWTEFGAACAISRSREIHHQREQLKTHPWKRHEQFSGLGAVSRKFLATAYVPEVSR